MGGGGENTHLVSLSDIDPGHNSVTIHKVIIVVIVVIIVVVKK